MSRLILCADDFAYSREVSETIVALAMAGKVNAISCMTGMPGWHPDSRLLQTVPAHVQIGLHLTLTGECPLTDMPELAPRGVLPDINTLQRRAARWDLPFGEIADEIRAQFAAFVQAMGRAPDFVDGHQHAHALPGIREIVLAEVACRAPLSWVRACSDRFSSMMRRPFLGKAIGSSFHTRGFRRAAAAYGIATNDSFGGHYDFAGDYAGLFGRFLRGGRGMHLVMCHPGAGERADDVIAEARRREAETLIKLPIADMAARAGMAFPGRVEGRRGSVAGRSEGRFHRAEAHVAAASGRAAG